MKKLFTNDFIFEKGFLTPEVCQRWQETIFENPKIFGQGVEPEYGQLAAFYSMLELGLNESYFRFAAQHNKFLAQKFPEIKIDDRSIAILNKHRNLFFRLLQWIFGPELVPTASLKAAKEMRNSFFEKVSQLNDEEQKQLLRKD